jgi:hypothetical protein
MKIKWIQIITVIGILSLLPIFMGQDNCQINNKFKQLFKQIGTKLPPPSGQAKTYVTHLAFMDARTQSTMISTEKAELLSKALEKGMKEAANQNPKLAINDPGHQIKNNDKNVNSLLNICFDPGMSKIEKVNTIISKLMNPNKVDVIVTGQYIDDAKNPLISIRPLVIVKGEQKIVSKNLQFSKEELFCTDAVSKKEILCAGADNQIAQAVQNLLSQL